MSLIELLMAYQKQLMAHGRFAANRWLEDYRGDSKALLVKEIKDTFSDSGAFVTGQGTILQVRVTLPYL